VQNLDNIYVAQSAFPTRKKWFCWSI